MKDILRKQITELEKLLELKDKRIAELTTNQEPVRQECLHDYPAVWHGVFPPVCNKCGKQAQMFNPWWNDYTTGTTEVNPHIVVGPYCCDGTIDSTYIHLIPSNGHLKLYP